MARWYDDELTIDGSHKAFRALKPRPLGAQIADGLRLSELPSPVATLHADAVEHNSRIFNEWLDSRGALLAPHGKTTMAPALWKLQLEHGAWAITVATPWQLRVAVTHGVKRVMHAAPILHPADLAIVAGLLADDPELEIIVWCDGPDVARLLAERYPADARPLQVMIERGGPGARTGARSKDEAMQTAQIIAAAPNLAILGVSAWEGSLVGAGGPDGRALIAQFCDGVAETYEALEHAGLLPADRRPIITAGGSAYFDIVSDRWQHLADRAQVVLRSGCYLTHDDGSYGLSSPLAAGKVADPLRSALHVWAQVISRPEPGLALLNLGKRDVTYDSVYPVPQRVTGRADGGVAALQGAAVIDINDQHAYLQLDPASDLAVGEVVRFGAAHPCLTFDKWSVIPVIDDPDADDPRVIGAVRTHF